MNNKSKEKSSFELLTGGQPPIMTDYHMHFVTCELGQWIN